MFLKLTISELEQLKLYQKEGITPNNFTTKHQLYKFKAKAKMFLFEGTNVKYFISKHKRSFF
jgi:hypothetical protein